MQRVFRPLAVFTIATAVGVAVGLRAALVGDGRVPTVGEAFASGYDLAQIELVRATLYHVDQGYVDPSRVRWDAMVDAGLDAVETLVPSVLFTRSDARDTLAVDVGDFHTVIDAPAARSRQDAEDLLEQVAGLLAAHLSVADLPEESDPTGGAPMARVEYALINGMLSTLDPHTVLLPPEAAHEMDLDNQGEFGGLGITIAIDDEHHQLTIECPVPGTPAAAAGIRPGDRVLRIDGESTVNMTLDDAIERLRGPEGSVAHLVVARQGSDEAVPIDVTRALIDSNPVESALLEGNVGWIRIASFHEKVSAEVAAGLERLHREAAGDLAGLVLDVRGNPGGFLNQAVRVADLFLDAGDIVSTVDGSGRETEPPDVAGPPSEPGYPIVVVVDAQSASASEILAGALRYNERAVVVGERTFGKGSVQNLQTFFDDSKLKLTISRYLTPGDRSLQGVGVPADVELVPAAFDAEGPSLYHRERVRREADLQAALDASPGGFDEPAWRIRYVEPDVGRTCEVGPDLATDRELALARLILVSAQRRWRRPDVLSAAGQVVASQQRALDAELTAALQARGVAWQAGPGPAGPGPTGPGPAGPGPAGPGPTGSGAEAAPVVVAWAGGGPTLASGAEAEVGLSVTNTSAAPLYRVSAVSRGASALDGREWFFGRLDPGETRTATVRVRVAPGEPAEHDVEVVSVRAGDGGEIAAVELPLDVAGRPTPRFAWTLSPVDASGDGVLRPGEELRVGVELTPIGGDAVAPFVRLRNRSGPNVELLDARFEPGPLAAGATAAGTLSLRVADRADLPALSFELEVGDEAAFDRGVVIRAEHFDRYQQRVPLTWVPGEALPAPARWEGPSIEITRPPPAQASGRVTISGLVADDRGLTEVEVFLGGDKLFTEGRRAGASFRSIPFTADVALEPGSNVISVLARDVDGLVAGRSVVVWSAEPKVLANARP